MPALPAVPPGARCQSDYPGSRPHLIAHPDKDADLQAVANSLLAEPLATLLTRAVDDAITYVVDPARTGRFDLMDPAVDSDERRGVGTKLQYHVIETLGLVRTRHPDTHIAGVPVDIKGTVRGNWSIPREGQCEICLLIQVDAAQDRFQAYVMRTHREWLNGGRGNGDQKRGVRTEPLNRYAVQLLGWTPLPTNPLKRLTPAQRTVVFDQAVGQKRRMTALFGYLPSTVIPRHVIETVGYGNKDSLRRCRQAKPDVLAQHGLRVLCGTWVGERQEAARLGYDIAPDSWIAVPAAPAAATPRTP